jgi:chemotaxis protein MotD
VFSVTPEPAVSKPAFDPQARQTRTDQPSDGFAALVDSNASAASDIDRPARPAPEAPRLDTRGPDTPPASDRQQSDSSATPSKNDSGVTQQDDKSSSTVDATASDGKSTGKIKSTSGDSKSGDKSQDDDTAAAAATPAIPAIVTDPVAVVIAAAAAPATVTTDKTSSATTAAAAATTASASAIITPADAAAAQAEATANAAIASATAATDPSVSTVETATPEAKVATVSAAATVIKSDSGKTEIVAKDGETSAPSKEAKSAKQADESSAKPVTGQTIKSESNSEQTGDKSQPHDKAASESGSTDTESSKHAAKTTPQTEHRAAASAPQQPLPTDPALMQPATTLPQQPIQTHTANLTAIPVQAANSALADAPVPLNGLAADIALRAAGGNSRFEIRLDPAELGRIDVRLDVDKHGNVTSHLTVERPATLDMLRNDAPRLQQALEDAGLKTGDSGLQFSLRDQSSSGRDGDNGSGRNSQRVVVTEEDTIPAQVAGRTYGRMLGASSGVDIRI